MVLLRIALLKEASKTLSPGKASLWPCVNGRTVPVNLKPAQQHRHDADFTATYPLLSPYITSQYRMENVLLLAKNQLGLCWRGLTESVKSQPAFELGNKSYPH